MTVAEMERKIAKDFKSWMRVSGTENCKRMYCKGMITFDELLKCIHDQEVENLREKNRRELCQ